MPPDKKNSVIEQMGKYYSIAFLLPACILVGFLMGYFLDKWLGTTMLKIVFLLLGVAAGIIEVIRELGKDDASG
jgi:ATP synthase protein I